MRPSALGVIGLGAMGGSVAWQAARAGVSSILGLSLSPTDAVAAVKNGAVTRVCRTPEEIAGDADLIVLATPPNTNVALLDRLADAETGALITDVGGVKAGIVTHAERRGVFNRFCGSHPFCETHVRGFSGARSDMFAGTVVYLTPATGGEDVAREIEDFWVTVMGAQCVRVPATIHDRIVAESSQLPHAAAVALAVALARSDLTGITYGSGLRDTTRLAAGDETSLRDVFQANRERVLEALGRMEGALADLRHALETGDEAALTAWLQEGAAFRRRIT